MNEMFRMFVKDVEDFSKRFSSINKYYCERNYNAVRLHFSTTKGDCMNWRCIHTYKHEIENRFTDLIIAFNTFFSKLEFYYRMNKFKKEINLNIVNSFVVIHLEDNF